MTTVTRTFTWNNANSTDLNAWVNEVHTTFSSAGLTQTTDTGQIALSGLTWVNTTGTTWGYEIWKFPDALQTTTPIFIKVEYRNNTSSATKPMLQVSVASSTDGAGTLTTTAGPIHGPHSSSVTGSFQASRVSYACYTDSTFALVLAKEVAASSQTVNNSMYAMVIDRARDNSGVAQAGGYLVVINQYNTTSPTVRHMYGASTTGASSSGPIYWPNQSAVGSTEGTTVNVIRPYMQTPGVHPSLGFLGYWYNEIADITPQTFTVLGSSHTFMPMGQSFNRLGAPSDNACAAIRWE